MRDQCATSFGLHHFQFCAVSLQSFPSFLKPLTGDASTLHLAVGCLAGSRLEPIPGRPETDPGLLDWYRHAHTFTCRRLAGETNREIVSCRAVRACVRACARFCCLVELSRKRSCLPFLFSLLGLASFPSSFFGLASVLFSLVWVMYKVYEEYKK